MIRNRPGRNPAFLVGGTQALATEYENNRLPCRLAFGGQTAWKREAEISGYSPTDRRDRF